MLKIVAIGAHPDDIEIFMYGFLGACRNRGDNLSLIVATDGAAGTVAGGSGGAELALMRAAETKQGLSALGEPTLLNLPDGKLAQTPSAAAIICESIAQAEPDLIITHAPEDYHPDHRALAAMVADAGSFNAPLLFADTLMGVGFMPEFYVDTTTLASEKKTAIMAHKSQHPERFARAAAIADRFRAAQCNAPDDHRAEAFRLARRFPFADIRAMLPPPPPLRPFYTGASDALI